MGNLKNWKVIKSERVFTNHFVKIRKDVVQTESGQIIDDFYVREMPDIAVVFGLTADNKVVLNREYKHGISYVVMELPAGAVEDNEEPIVAAKREFEEETGYTVSKLEEVGSMIVSPTDQDGRVHVFLGKNAEKNGCKKNTPTEYIENELVSLDEILDYVKKGEIEVQWSVAAVYLVLDHLGIISYQLENK